MLLLIYSFELMPAFLSYLFPALATPRSAISAVAQLLFPVSSCDREL